MSEYRYVFGPVPSRRLGRSLGVDIVPFKTCTFDCIYCQLGPTTNKTIERRSYVPVEDVLDEVKHRLASDLRPDYITLSGSGEPTLNADVGSVIEGIKSITKIPVAVLTNGSFLWMEDVRKALLLADLVVPSLDAGTPETFEHINRPHETISFEQMVEGMIAFREEYSGNLWLEVFLVEGINDSDEEINHIVDLAKWIGPNRVQINTVTRPPAEASARPLSRERLEEIAQRFVPPAEVIADVSPDIPDRKMGCMEDIASMCRRRPCTLQDISKSLGLNPSEVSKYLQELQRQGSIETKELDGRTYFVA
jgi:wyosine [tRNA(Phe)-imidazoG37] synthetase (radical SAM superfamily)